MACRKKNEEPQFYLTYIFSLENGLMDLFLNFPGFSLQKKRLSMFVNQKVIPKHEEPHAKRWFGGSCQKSCSDEI